MIHQLQDKGRRLKRVAHGIAFIAGVSLSATTACKGPDWCAPDFCENEGYAGYGYFPYICKPTTGFREVKCFTSDIEAVFWCQGKGGNARAPICDGTYGGGTGETGETGETDGTETSGDSNAPDWSPSEHVAFNAPLDQYEIDATFVEEVKADTSVLALDHSYVQPIESAHYQLHNVKKGDLAYAMGLRSGDVLVNLNGFELNSLNSLLEAYDDLEHVDELFLTVERGVDPMQFTYVIIDDR